MRVLFATYPMAFHTPGGGEIQLINYARHLRELGIEVDFFDPWSPNFLSYDLVHFFSCIGGSEPLCRFIKDLRIPLVITSSLWITEETRHLYDCAQIRNQLLTANRIITNSNMESDTLARVLDLPRENFAHVYNGVDVSFVRAESSNYNRSDGYFLNVANIEARKNQKRLIEAFKQFPDQTLVIAGHIRDQAYFDTCDIENNSQVRYIGYLEPNSPALIDAYQKCRALILPSILETPGIAALEAAACGAPLIVTSEGSTKEYFGSSAYYVNPHSIEDIAKAIREILNDELSARLASVRVSTWAAVADDLKNIYEHVIFSAR